MARTTSSGETLLPVIVVDPDGIPAHLVDVADGSSLLTIQARNYVWDAVGLSWVRETQPAGGGGGGGGAMTVANGADVTEGATGDVAVVGDNTGTISAKLRGINKALAGNLAVTGTFWQGTQPISGNVGLLAGSAVIGHVVVDTAPSTPVTNAGTFAVQATLAAETSKVIGTVNQGTNPWVVSAANLDVALSTRLKPGDTLTGVTTVAAVTSITNPVAVTGTFWQATQPISGTVTGNQGAAAALGNAWPVYGTFSGAAIDPRLIAGQVANNVAIPGTVNPVLVSGSDSVGTNRGLLTDSAGALMVLHRYEVFDEILLELRRLTLGVSILSGDDLTGLDDL